MFPTEFDSDCKICIVTHVDQDGVASGLISAAAVELLTIPGEIPKVNVNFIGYSKGIGQRMKEAIEAETYDAVFITDISLRNNPGGDQDMDIFIELVKSYPDTLFVFTDHHSSTQTELLPDTANLIWAVVRDKEADKCGADIIFELMFEYYGLWQWCIPSRLDTLRRIKELAHDYDLWHHKHPESTDISDAITVLGPRKVYEYLSENPELIVNYPKHDILWNAVLRARKQRDESLTLARETRTVVEIAGQKYAFGICKGYSSEAGHVLAGGDPNIAAIALDLRHETTGGFNPSLSLRRADGSTINLKEIAEKLGGGGHEYAAGGKVPIENLLQVMLAETVRYCQDKLS